jgi:hypothetical protein
LWDGRVMRASRCTLDQAHDLLHAVPVGPDYGALHTALEGWEATEYQQPRMTTAQVRMAPQTVQVLGE